MNYWAMGGLWLSFWGITAFFSSVSFSASAPDCTAKAQALERRATELEAQIERLEVETEILSRYAHSLLQQSVLGFRNRLYGKAGFTILFPRYPSFSFGIFGYGIGMFAGVGKYFGQHGVSSRKPELDLWAGGGSSSAVGPIVY